MGCLGENRGIGTQDYWPPQSRRVTWVIPENEDSGSKLFSPFLSILALPKNIKTANGKFCVPRKS
jgi:hypothetical protein